MSSRDASHVVFFDALGTLGAEWADWRGQRLARFLPFDWIPRVLESLAPRARLGVVATDPKIPREKLVAALGGAGLLEWIERDLVVVAELGETGPFERALAAAGRARSAGRALYVGPDAAHRTRAFRAGMRAAPHALLAEAAVGGEALEYVRVAANPDSRPDWPSIAEGLSLVPVLIDDEREPTLYAVASTSAVARLAESGLQVERLGEPAHVERTDLYLYQVTTEQVNDSEELRIFLKTLPDMLSSVKPHLPALVRSVPRGLLTGIPGEISVDVLHPPGAGHGHTLALLPSPGSFVSAQSTAPLVARPLTLDERSDVGDLDETLYQGELDKPWRDGATPAASPGGAAPTVSRHVYHPGNPKAVNELAAALAQVCGAANVRRLPFSQLGWTFENVEAEIPGTSDELVIVAAHLDSTAKNQFPYAPQNDSAPGADDDASGVAGVLAAAKVLSALSASSPPRRTIRFLLFNAEEQGMEGSEWYAEQLKTVEQRTVAAMLQMDMIGWVSDTNRIVEVHATGSADFPTAHPSSIQLAAVLAQALGQVSPALSVQSYPLPGCSHDPAAHRSDHNSFHYHGWPACLVAEDLWADLCASPVKQTGNPDYHKATDVSVDAAFAADVARAVASAAWIVAAP